MSPEELDLKLRAFQESRILLTAIELNVFSAVDGGATAEEAALRLGTLPRATEKLLNALTALGLLHKRDGVFGNEPLAARLLADASPESARYGMLHLAHRWHTWSTLTGSLRGVTSPEEYPMLDRGRHEKHLAMQNWRAAERAPRLVAAIGTHGVHRLLDIGGGSAAYSIAFASTSPEIEAEVFDLPEVVPITSRYIAGSGLGRRVRARSGDMLSDEFGSGYDLILMFSVAHLMGEQENRGIFRRCHRALGPGGRLAIHDHLLAADKTGPRAGVIMALNMLLATRNGSTYSYEEYASWLRDAGFSAVERREFGGPTGVVIGTR